ncbi:MAG: ADOP family duplicated permease, partial [Longimicrobiales bacterium]|nr:ADOP family duplicated permease [Longimicrobiales bacterium]
DREEMALTLRDQLEGAPSSWERTRIGWRALRRTPGVVVTEWLDWLGPSTRHEGDGMMGSWLRNLGFAGRSLRKAPTFSVATIVLVALGVGTVVTAFTVVDHVLLRPLPYPAADRLAYLTNGSHNGPTLERLDGIEAFEMWTVTSGSSVNLTRVDGDPLRLLRTETTPEFFTMFGARPYLGRLLVDGDRNDTGIAVVTYPFWRDVLGADPDVVGTTMTIDGEPIEIVGVLSEDFVQPGQLGEPDFYRPMDWTNPGLEQPGYHAHSVTARLQPGVTLEQANEQIDRLEADVAAAYPEYYEEGPRDWPLESLHATTVEDVRGGLYLLLGAVGLLLLVACANVAHLFMARGLSRAREMSIRRAMGARTWNLIGQLSAESLVVGLLGGAGGLILAQGGLAFFRRWTVDLPRGTAVTMDLRVFAVAIGLATLTALLFGLVPALRTVGRDVHVGLRAGGRGVSGGRGIQAFRSGLVIFEVAVSLVLVASAGLLMRSFASVTSIDPGIETEGVWVVPLNVANVETPEEYRQRLEPVRRALDDIPGVQSATYSLEVPFQFVGGNRCCWGNRATPPGESEDNSVRLHMHPVAPAYFETLGTELVAGEMWTSATATASPRPAVVSEPLAVRFWGSAEAAIGRELDNAGGAIVVGVAEATRHYGLDQEHDHALYLPVEALPFAAPMASFALRTQEAGSGFSRQIREAIWSQEPTLPVPEVAPLESWVSDSSATRRFGSFLFGAFGVVALLLAAAGLYGTLLYTVGQRKQELGIRLALGAGRGRIQGDVIRKGVVQAGVGVVVGAGIALWVGGLLEAFLFGVSTTDPVALGSAAGVLFLTAVAASWFPAYRAGRTDPLETLKAE